MEYNNPVRGENGPGLCGGDREVFERVWRRVMPADVYGSPVQLIGEEPTPRLYDSEGGGPDPDRPEPPRPAHPIAPQPAPVCPAAACLGPGSAAYGAQLQAFTAYEIASFRDYMALARRCKGNAAHVLTGMANEERRHAKRLSAAYFLISGVRYWPGEPSAPAPAGPMPACLRQAFQSEQRAEAAYRSAAASTDDPCLHELYLELADDESAHAWLIRGLVEAL